MDWEIDYIEKFSSHLGDFLLKIQRKNNEKIEENGSWF